MRCAQRADTARPGDAAGSVQSVEMLRRDLEALEAGRTDITHELSGKR